MNPRELVDHIRSGPAELLLYESLRFRRRTRSNPCDFNEFIPALQSSETIRTVRFRSHQTLRITEDEWVLLVKTIGSIKGIQILNLQCTHGSRDFHPIQAVAEAVNSAHSMRELSVHVDGGTFLRDSSGLAAFASTLRVHRGLQKFSLGDSRPLLEGAQGTAFNPLLRELSVCPHLKRLSVNTKCASADAMKNLLQLQSTTALCLVLEKENWLAVTDEIRRGRCNVQTLTLTLDMSRDNIGRYGSCQSSS
jgi:hypothetical protein